MFHLALRLTLRPGAFEKYRRAHDDIWPELAEGMRANEVSMAIYRDEDRLFVFAAAPSEAHWQHSREDPALASWNQCMAEFLLTDENDRLELTPLTKAFGFGEFK